MVNPEGSAVGGASRRVLAAFGPQVLPPPAAASGGMPLGRENTPPDGENALPGAGAAKPSERGGLAERKTTPPEASAAPPATRGSHEGELAPAAGAAGPCVGGGSVPLVRFDSSDALELQGEGLALLRALPSPVRLVAFVGRGRCGKSSTCSRLTGQPEDAPGFERFKAGHDHRPMTEGADIAAVACEDGGCVVYLDIEGSDNPTSKNLSHFNVLSMLAFLLSSHVVYCEFGDLKESTLEGLAATVAARRMIASQEDQYQPALCLLVIGQRFAAPPDQLKTLLEDPQYTGERLELRKSILGGFQTRHLHSLPRLEEAGYDPSVKELRSHIALETGPARSAGMLLRGAEVADVLQGLCAEIQQRFQDSSFKSAMRPDSAYARVVKARLEASADEAFAQYKASLPPLDHWQENLHNRSSIEAPAAQYDSLTAGFTTVLKKEVRKALQGRLTRAREETLAKNEEFRRAEVQVIVAAAKAGKEAIAKVCPSLPLARVVPDTELKQLADRRQNVMDRFDRAVAAMRCAYMVAEARKELDTKLDEMLRKVRDASAVLKVSIKASLRDAAEAQLNTWDDLQDSGDLAWVERHAAALATFDVAVSAVASCKSAEGKETWEAAIAAEEREKLKAALDEALAAKLEVLRRARRQQRQRTGGLLLLSALLPALLLAPQETALGSAMRRVRDLALTPGAHWLPSVSAPAPAQAFGEILRAAESAPAEPEEDSLPPAPPVPVAWMQPPALAQAPAPVERAEDGSETSASDGSGEEQAPAGGEAEVSQIPAAESEGLASDSDEWEADAEGEREASQRPKPTRPELPGSDLMHRGWRKAMGHPWMLAAVGVCVVGDLAYVGALRMQSGV